MVDLMLVGQLGDNSVAAVGRQTQVYFNFQIGIFWNDTGSARFTAEFGGKNEHKIQSAQL